jgi:hypothetical protein
MGKGHHHCVVIDAEGRKLLSQRVANDEAALLELIAEVTGMSEHDVVWAVDLVDGGAVLLTALLLDRRQVVVYLPGRAVHRPAGMYRGEAKTDAREPAVIADPARMRRDLQQLTPADPIAADLRVLTAPARPRGRSHPGDQPARGTAVELFPGAGTGVRRQPQQGCADLVDRVPHPGPDPRAARVPAGVLAEDPRRALRREDRGRGGRGGGAAAAVSVAG